MSYDQLLPYRPPNVVQQFHSDESIPLLNGRHLLAAAASMSGYVCWAPAIHDYAAVIGLLRAVAHRKAFVGLTMMPESADRQQLKQVYSPKDYFRMVIEAAGQVVDTPPFFLHIQEPPVQLSLRVDFEAVRDHIASCIEAGFTSFGLDLSRCNVSQVPQAAVELLQPVLDFDLGIVVRLPEKEIDKHVVALREHGIEPSLVVLPGLDEIGDEAMRIADRIGSVVVPSGVAWRDSKKHTTDHNTVGGLIKTQVKALVGGDRFACTQTHAGGDIDPEKREALVYMEAICLLDKLGQRSSALKLYNLLQS